MGRIHTIFALQLPDSDDSDNQLEAENQSKGTVKASIWWEYFHAGNSISGLLCITLILIISQVICSGADYFVNVYTKIIFMDKLNQSTAISEDLCLIIYSVLILTVIIVSCELLAHFDQITRDIFVTDDYPALLSLFENLYACFESSSRTNVGLYSKSNYGILRYQPIGTHFKSFHKRYGRYGRAVAQVYVRIHTLSLSYVGSFGRNLHCQSHNVVSCACCNPSRLYHH